MGKAAAKPVYVLFGQDAFLCDAHRREIIQLALGDADPQVCLSTLDATAELAEVLDELRTLPFLAPRRVVIVRDADAFVGAYRGQLEDYLRSPTQTATLVLMVSSWPKTTRLFKLVQQIGQAIDCNTPQRGVQQWLARSAGKRGKKMAPDAAELLVAWLGNDLAVLHEELEKLVLYVGQRDSITAEDVSALVTATAGAGAFALNDALVAGNAQAGLAALDGMLTARGEEFRVLGMIASHLRRALRAQQLAAAGKPPEGVLNPKMPYRAKNAFLAMLRRRPLAALQADFRRLIRADLGMKSGLEPKATLQELVVELCR